jgi:hypothetical protein
MEALMHLTDSYRRKKALLERQLDLLGSTKSGGYRIGQTRPYAVDLTECEKNRIRRHISVYGRLIRQYDPHLN